MVDSPFPQFSDLAPVDVVPAEALPTDLDPLPALLTEHETNRRSDWPLGTADDEPVCDLAGTDLLLLHSYRRAGLRTAIDRQLLRSDALRRLLAARRELPAGFGLAVFDSWRPLALQRELFDAAYGSGGNTVPGAVAPPSTDPRTPPPHLTGGTVDLTLSWQGRPLALGTGFDEFTALAATAAFEADPGPVRTLRRLLYWTLRGHGFVVLAEEWWHVEYGTRLWSTITGHEVRYGPAAT